MIDDIHEPLEQYAAHFKTAHADNTSDLFEDLVRQSGIDEDANVKTVKELRQLEQRARGASSTGKWWRILRGVVIAAALSALLYVATHFSWPWLAAPTVVFSLAIYWLSRVIKNSHARLEELEQACEAKRAEAWGQIVPVQPQRDSGFGCIV